MPLTEPQLPTIKAEFGPPGRDAVGFVALRLNTATAPSEHPAIRTGPNVDRTGRSGLFAFVLDSLGSGFRPLSTIGSYGFDKSTVWKNEGVMVHIPGQVCLPYKLTSQSSIIASDHTGLNDGNRRVHSVNWAASDGLRWIGGVGPNIIKDTSVSNPALTVPSTNDNVTDDILTMWVGPFGANPQCLFIGTDGQTDDIKYTTDPTANSISWTSAVTFANVNDRCWGGAWMPQLGSGWHVFMGKINDVPGWYAFQPSNTAPLTSSTLAPIVWEDTKDQAGDLAITNTGAVFADTFTVAAGPGQSGGLTITNPTNIRANDGAEVEVSSTVSGGNPGSGNEAYMTFLFNFSDLLPSGGWEPTGYVFTYERREGDAADNASFRNIFLISGITNSDVTAASAPQIDRLEFNTVAETLTHPSSGTTDRWGASLTPEQIRANDFGVAGFLIAVATWNVFFDYATMTVYYRFNGTLVTPSQGGFTIGPQPSNPNVLPTVEPVTDQETTITQRRELKLNEFTFDTTSQKPTMSRIVKPATGMGYVGVAAHFQGGVVVFGGNNSTVFNECKLVDSEGIVRNLNMPKTHAGEPITAVKAKAQGNALLVWVANVDNTDVQLWMFFDGIWHALGVLQSKSSAITQRPLYWAETEDGLEQSQGYLLIPNSTTSLMGTRQFVPPSLFDDPHITNTAELKHDGPLAVTLPILDMGTIETKKSLLTLQAQSYRLDDDTLYGTAQLEIDTTGDLTLASPAVDVTFGTGVGQTPPFQDVSTDEDANNPGVSIPTGVIRLTLDNAAGTAKSPQPLPIVFWMTGQWPLDDTESFFLPQKQGFSDPRHIYERMKSLIETTEKPSHWLTWNGLEGGSEKHRAAFLGARFGQSVKFATLDATGRPQTQEYQGITLDFRLLPGADA